MHRINYTIRRIVDADLPQIRDVESSQSREATDAELLSLGLMRIADDIFSCVEQLRRGPETLEWEAFGHSPVGELLAHGVNRFDQLPDDVRPQVLQARVIKADIDGGVRALVAEQLTVQKDAVMEFVGPGVIDLDAPDATLDEARRLVDVPDSGVEVVTLPMADVDESMQIVEATNIIPHLWAGEPRPRR